MWKFLSAFLVVISIGILGMVFINMNKDLEKSGVELSPFTKITKEIEPEEKIEKPEEITKNEINMMLFGIDRRSREEYGFRTDIMILLSIDMDSKNVVLTSLPRDLWWNGGRLNAAYLAEGWNGFQDAVETITGKRPEKFILTDFRDFSWVVDAMGGVPVAVDTTFTDSSYPVDETKEYQTISFTQGPELLTGERALIYSRSRKGDNGEGSDWMRMRRQHKILNGMLDAVIQPKSIFNPMIVESAYKSVTEGKMDTNLTVEDAKYLWSFYKDRKEYAISSLFLDYDYLYSPPLEDYGGAWVLVPTSGSYDDFKMVLDSTLKGIELPAVETESNDIEN